MNHRQQAGHRREMCRLLPSKERRGLVQGETLQGHPLPNNTLRCGQTLYCYCSGHWGRPGELSVYCLSFSSSFLCCHSCSISTYYSRNLTGVCLSMDLIQLDVPSFLYLEPVYLIRLVNSYVYIYIYRDG